MSLLGMPVIWVVEDLIVLVVMTLTLVFVLRREERPLQIVLELFCFIVFYAGAYENLGTILPLYHYGRSLIMIANVPITVPIIEYLVVYSALRMLGKMRIPTWCKPLIVGFFGMLQDFTLDPLAVRQVFQTTGGAIGRWSWVMGQGDVNILGIPVFNFPGWMLILGWGSAFLLLGRWWFERSKRRPVVGYLYPVLTMLAGLHRLLKKSHCERFVTGHDFSRADKSVIFNPDRLSTRRHTIASLGDVRLRRAPHVPRCSCPLEESSCANIRHPVRTHRLVPG